MSDIFFERRYYVGYINGVSRAYMMIDFFFF